MGNPFITTNAPPPPSPLYAGDRAGKGAWCLARSAAFAFVALFVALATGCAPDRAPAARFQRQAEQLHDGVLASTITPNDELNDYVQEIGRRLEAAAKDVVPDKASGPFFQSMQFHLGDSPIVNVYTTGGAHVYVYRGLWEFCRSEEELAAAIAHAYAHAINLDV